MNSIENLVELKPFQLDRLNKANLFATAMHESFKHHLDHNVLFKQYCKNINFNINAANSTLKEFPYLPVDIFKRKNLISVDQDDIITKLNSSATSGVPSTIALDGITSKRQILVSGKVMSEYLGSDRTPFIIIDEDPLIKNKKEISARAAATRGFLTLCSDPNYCLECVNDTLVFDFEKFMKIIHEFKKRKTKTRIFGFTYILYNKVVKYLSDNNLKLDLGDKFQIAHIGGWKKLENSKVTKRVFLDQIYNTLGIKEENVFDFYGFTEQMGLIYASVGSGPKTVTNYSEIIIRDYNTLEPVEDNNEGLIQILTPIPNSYPGISVLTEDIGKIIGREKDKYGREGTQFEVIGRASQSEARGCGDIMSEYVA